MEDIDFDAPIYDEVNKKHAWDIINTRSDLTDAMCVETLVKVFWADRWGETYADYDARVRDCTHENTRALKQYAGFERECLNCYRYYNFIRKQDREWH